MIDSQNSEREIHHPHDKGYKRLLSFWKIFRQLIEGYVPGGWVDHLDYEKNIKVDKTFVSEEYEERESDILYKVPVLGQEEEIFLYVLIEHQSTVDFLMPFRVLSYLVRVWEEVYKNSDKDLRRQKGYRLPPVFPIVLYNGDPPWTASTQLKEMVKMGETFAGFLPDFSYHLIDVSRQNPGKLKQLDNCLAGVFLLERQVENKEFKRIYSDALELIYKETDPEILKAVIEWVLKRLRLSHGEKAEDLIEEIDWTKYNPQEVRSMLETMPKKLVESGKLEGKLEGKREDISKILNKRFGGISGDLQKRIQETSSVDVLDLLLELAIDSPTLEDFEEKARM